MWGRAGRRCSSNAQGGIFTSRPKFWDWHGAFGSWEGGEPAEGFACHLAGGSRLVRNWNSVFTWVLVVSRNDYHSKSVHKSEARFCWHVRVQLWSSSFSASEKKDQMLNDCPIEVDHPHVTRGTSQTSSNSSSWAQGGCDRDGLPWMSRWMWRFE